MTIAEKIARAKADYDEVYEAGKKAEYDEFWEKYLAYAKRTGIAYCLFSGAGWNENTRIPYKIDFIRDGYNLFMYCGNIPKSEIAKIDFSKITNNFPTFNYSTEIREIPELDTRGVATVGIIFAYCSGLKSIDKIILRDDGSQSIGSFTNCTSLEEVRFEGTLGQNGLNLQWSKKLSAASIESVINILSDTTRDLTVTLSLEAVNKAFETAEGANDGSDSVSWRFLRGSKPYWNIALV